MERIAYNKLVEWKNKSNRKPLILNGVRQVGKTWLLKNFGQREYKNVAYINCDRTDEMKTIFSDFDTERLIRVFSALSNTTIEPGNTIIILDEIQVTPLGLTALKYFCEEAPEYHIVVAGSLLGIGLHEGTGFPVGKVDEITLHPMSFEEFLMAMGKDILLSQIKEHRWDELTSYSSTFIELLRQYYYVGGMPEVVNSYIENQDLQEVRSIQNQILADYKRNFSKHVPMDIIPKVNMVWDSIPAQLAKENKKYIFASVKKGARAKEFENAIQWLIEAGLVHKVPRVSKVCRPIKFYEEYNAFKLFCVDLGLLGAMSDVSAKDILVKDTAFKEYKGAFTEQYVLQQIIAQDIKAYYYSKDNSTLELDFIIQKEDVHPIEVKAEENLRSKSLSTIYNENKDLKPWRFSMAGFRQQDWMVNVPLYLIYEWIKASE